MIVDEIDEDDVLDYLEHVGVKGMRWGVRKAASGTALAHPGVKQRKANEAVEKRATKAGRTPGEQKSKEAKNFSTLDKVTIGLSVGAIGLTVANQIMKHRAVKMSKVAAFNRAASHNARAAKLVTDLGGVKMHEVRTGFRVGSTGVATPIIRRIAG